MDSYLDKAEKALIVVITVVGVILFLTAFRFISTADVVARTILGTLTTIAGVRELFPGKIAGLARSAVKILKRRKVDETDISKTTRFQRDTFKIR